MGSFTSTFAFILLLTAQAFALEIQYRVAFFKPGHNRPVVRTARGPVVETVDAARILTGLGSWSQNRYEAFEQNNQLVVRNLAPCQNFAATDGVLHDIRAVLHDEVPQVPR